MISSEDVFNRCTRIFRTVFLDSSLTITPATSASEIADWDSLAQIRILTMIEQEFEIRFSLDEAESLQDVGEIVALVVVKVKP